MNSSGETDDGPTVRLMVDGGQGGGMFRGLTGLVAMVVVVAVLLGLALGNPISGAFNRDRQAAETARIQAQADALHADADRQRQLTELDVKLTAERAQQQVTLDAERERQQIATDMRRQQLVADGLWLLLAAAAIGLFAVLFAAAIYIVRKAATLPPRRPSRRSSTTGRILPFPGKRDARSQTSISRDIHPEGWE